MARVVERRLQPLLPQLLRLVLVALGSVAAALAIVRPTRSVEVQVIWGAKPPGNGSVARACS